MRKLILVIISFFFFNLIHAQEDLPNKNFEEWDADTSLTGYVYYNPLNWDSPNEFIAFLDVSVVFRESDAIEGDYSAKMETKIMEIPFIGDVPVPGIITLGEIVVDIVNQTGGVKGGIPYTARPYALKAYVKSTQAENDSALIAAYSYKYNEETSEMDTISEAMIFLTEEISEWTEIKIPFEYKSDSTPDSLNVVCISSSSFESSYEGSILYVDQMSIEMESGLEYQIFGKYDVAAYPNPAGDYISFDFGEKMDNAILNIYNSNAELIISEKINLSIEKIFLNEFLKGSYFYQLIDEGKTAASGHFIKR